MTGLEGKWPSGRCWPLAGHACSRLRRASRSHRTGGTPYSADQVARVPPKTTRGHQRSPSLAYPSAVALGQPRFRFREGFQDSPSGRGNQPFSRSWRFRGSFFAPPHHHTHTHTSANQPKMGRSEGRPSLWSPPAAGRVWIIFHHCHCANQPSPAGPVPSWNGLLGAAPPTSGGNGMNPSRTVPCIG